MTMKHSFFIFIILSAMLGISAQHTADVHIRFSQKQKIIDDIIYKYELIDILKSHPYIAFTSGHSSQNCMIISQTDSIYNVYLSTPQINGLSQMTVPLTNKQLNRYFSLMDITHNDLNYRETNQYYFQNYYIAIFNANHDKILEWDLNSYPEIDNLPDFSIFYRIMYE